VATAEEDRLNFRRNPHTSFAAASDCRNTSARPQARRLSAATANIALLRLGQFRLDHAACTKLNLEDPRP
jgi:hypothetical protein